MKRRLSLVCEDEDDYAAIRVAARQIHGAKDPTDEQLGEAVATICRAAISQRDAKPEPHKELPGQLKLFGSGFPDPVGA